MHRPTDMMSPEALGISWLAATFAYPLALIIATLGQALGALMGGCHWIGFTIPLHRQVWALVDQPVMNFSSLPSAAGYWLGSLLLAPVVTVGIIQLRPRTRTRSLAGELLAVQIAWCASIIALAWLPLLDPDDGHLVGWLRIHGQPIQFIWIAPIVAAFLVLLPTIRLLALARRFRQHAGRRFRLLVVAIHLGIPAIGWAMGVTLILGSPPIAAWIGLLLAITVSFWFAWLRYPTTYIHQVEDPSMMSGAILLIATAITAVVIWSSGRILPENKVSGIVWSEPKAFNNIRPWIKPTSIDDFLPPALY